MYFLVSLRDRLHVPPADLGRPLSLSLADEITAKYVNRVLKNIGLIVAFHSFLCVDSDSDSSLALHPIDSGVHVAASFALIAYRPAVGEIITATIKAADSTGMMVDSGFFEHIFIPHDEMPDVSTFEFTEKPPVWAWNYQGDKLFMDMGQKVRIRITAVEYGKEPQQPPTAQIQPTQPGQPQPPALTHSQSQAQAQPQPANPTAHDDDKDGRRLRHVTSAMRVLASIKEDGLGIIEWWKQ